MSHMAMHFGPMMGIFGKPLCPEGPMQNFAQTRQNGQEVSHTNGSKSTDDVWSASQLGCLWTGQKFVLRKT